MIEKIVRGEVRELLIPVFFWYELEVSFSNMQGRNHAALIVIKFENGVVIDIAMYDSITDERYHDRCMTDSLRCFLKERLFPTLPVKQDKSLDNKKKSGWLRRPTPFRSM